MLGYDVYSESTMKHHLCQSCTMGEPTNRVEFIRHEYSWSWLRRMKWMFLVYKTEIFWYIIECWLNWSLTIKWLKWPVRIEVSSLGFHPRNVGALPARAAIKPCIAGRSSSRDRLHTFLLISPVVCLKLQWMQAFFQAAYETVSVLWRSNFISKT